MKFSGNVLVRGFTLVELMVVITIIGLLASAVVSSLSDSRKSARDAARVQAVKQLQNALELYRSANNGLYPCATAGCASIGAAAPVNVNGVVRNGAFDAAISLFYKASNDALLPTYGGLDGSIQYRVGSTNGTNNNPDRSTYTIILRRETSLGALPALSPCNISMGSGHSLWTVTPKCY